MHRAFGWPVFFASLAWAADVPGDAQQGRELFRTQNCVVCHSVDGQGGGLAPDLAKRIGRDQTPSGMAALMWNHAPAMWTAIQNKGLPVPRLTQQQAADLFAFFYSARYFEKPGDAARGRQIFQAKHCAQCHGLKSPQHPQAKPLAQWRSLNDPIALAEQMWNHSAEMKQAFAQKKFEWPQLSSQELNDLLVYLQNLPETRGKPGAFSPGAPEAGERLFEQKGCQSCHTGPRSHVRKYTGRTLTDFAVAMWNHSPKMMRKPPTLDYGEMRSIVGYLWSLQMFDQPGNAGRGKQVFARKNCGACHNDPASGAPSLTGRQGYLYPFAMVAALWQHGPNMLRKFEQKKMAWPRFDRTEMADLLAYLNGPASHAHR